MRERNLAPEVDDDLVEAIRKLKKLPASDKETLKVNLSQAYGRVYRAVALDFDGTCADEDQNPPDEILNTFIALLKRGIPVLIFTGRGKSESRKVGDIVRRRSEEQNIDLWYLRRLQFVVRNGESRLYTKTSQYQRFLEQDEFLFENSKATRQVRDRLYELLKHHSLNPEKKENAVRITNAGREHTASYPEILQFCTTNSVYILYSFYQSTPVIDFCFTHKGLALKKMAGRLGLKPDEILCIGDQGAQGGNDHEFLEGNNGFSVGNFSDRASGCFPVLNSCNTHTTGSNGTSVLLQNTLVVPPVSLSGEFFADRRRKLAGFEQFARRHGLETKRSTTHEIRAKYRYMIPTGQRFFSSHTLEIADLFDEFSGAVRLRDWEIEELEPIESVNTLYSLRDVWKNRKLNTERTLDTDTGLILRGSHYYWSLSRADERRFANLPEFLECMQQYFRDAQEVADDSQFDRPSLPKFKVVLSVFDNIRNTLLTVIYAHWLRYQEDQKELNTIVKCHDLLVRNSTEFVKILLDLNHPWHQSVARLKELVRDVIKYVQHISRDFVLASCDQELFKFRECDYFLESYIATRNAILDFERHGWFPQRKLQVLGIAYGGMELPILAQVASCFSGLESRCLFGKWSLYSEKQIELSELPDYVKYLKQSAANRPLMSIGKPDFDVPLIIADDNCTTCKTIQQVHDALVYRRFTVAGAIVVRYPGTNRLYHMAQANHGFPDPESMFGFIRGLVSPSPYTRLAHNDAALSGGGPKYKDNIGVFDKSKHRICSLLRKNRVIDAKSESLK